MRILFILSMVLIANVTSANAAAVSKDMAQSYYNTCASKERPANLTKESQDYLCSCTAAKMMDHMTTEDIQDMNNSDLTIARPAVNHMLTKVYAPCMEYPARDHYYSTCVQNPQTAKVSKNPTKLCGCMADKIAKHLGQNSEEIFTGILRRNPNVSDPMSALEADPEFQNYTKKQIMGCLF